MYVFVSEDHMLDWQSCQICCPLAKKKKKKKLLLFVPASTCLALRHNIRSFSTWKNRLA